MLALTVKGEKLGELFSYGDVLVDECIMKIKDEGLELSGIDERQIGMVSVAVNSGVFDSYEAKESVVGLPVGKFVKVLDVVENDDLIRLYIDEECEEMNVSSGGLQYTMSLVDPNHVNATDAVDELSLGTTMVMSGDTLTGIIDGVGGMYSFIKWDVDSDGEVTVFAENEESVFDSVFTPDDFLKSELTDCVGEYRVEYLENIRRVIPGDARVAVQLDNEYPAKIRFKTNEGDSSIEYVLAPRVRDN